MINLYNQVPTIYCQASRDFQYLSWLINIVLNSVKHNVDDLYDLPQSGVDPKISELLAFTLGFKIRRNYDKAQLLALTNIIPKLLRYKGTKYALELAGNALIKSSGAMGECKILDDEEALKQGIIKVFLPKDLIDTSLFMDLLPYILPAGMTCSIVRKTIESNYFETIFSYQSTALAKWYEDVELTDNGLVKGVSGLFEAFDASDNNKEPEFTNYTKNSTPPPDNYVLNAGLLDNTVIPVIDDQLLDFNGAGDDE